MSNRPRPERWAYFDCFAGLSGDMTLGAMLDAGLDQAALEDALHHLEIPGFHLQTHRVTKDHLTGIKVDFILERDQPARSYSTIVGIISEAGLSDAVLDLSLRMFRLLAEVEARIHGQPVEKVHFHELGAVDTILDVVGVAFGAEALGITRTLVSPIPQGWGMIASGHGHLPNPAPATLELLKGFSVYGTDLSGELVTPTGAVILKALGAESELCPSMRLEQVGYGAGSRNLPGHPNLLRLYLGEPLAQSMGHRERVLVLETHIDDMNPEVYEPLMVGLFAAGRPGCGPGPHPDEKKPPRGAPHRGGAARRPGGPAGAPVPGFHHLGGEGPGGGAGGGPALAGNHYHPLWGAVGEGYGVRRPPPAAPGI